MVQGVKRCVSIRARAEISSTHSWDGRHGRIPEPFWSASVAVSVSSRFIERPRCKRYNACEPPQTCTNMYSAHGHTRSAEEHSGMTRLQEILTLDLMQTFSWHIASRRHPAAFFKGRVGKLRQSGPQSLKCLLSGYLQGTTANSTTWQMSSVTWKTVSCDNTSLLSHQW